MGSNYTGVKFGLIWPCYKDGASCRGWDDMQCPIRPKERELHINWDRGEQCRSQEGDGTPQIKNKIKKKNSKQIYQQK